MAIHRADKTPQTLTSQTTTAALAADISSARLPRPVRFQVQVRPLFTLSQPVDSSLFDWPVNCVTPSTETKTEITSWLKLGASSRAASFTFA